MKSFLYPGIVFVAGILICGCTKTNNEPPLPEENEIRVTATINETASRVSGADWTVGDVIGISSNKGHNNIAYSATTTAGEFAPTTGGIAVSDNDELLLTAYYPHDPANTNGSISFDVVNSDQTPKDASKIDFMYAPTVKATRHNPNVNFGFGHCMTKLNLTINSGDGAVPAGAKITYTLSGLATSGTFNTSTGNIVAGAKTGTLKSTTTLGTKATVILPSHTIANTDPITITVQIESGSVGDTYTGVITPALVPANEYSYTFSLNYGSSLSVSSTSISGWTQNNGGNVSLTQTGQQDPPVPAKASVGDYLLSDGSILPKGDISDDNKSRIVGVVYYVGNDLATGGFPRTNGLAIALKDTDPDRFGSFTVDDVEDYMDLGGSNPGLVSGLVLEEMRVTSAQISSATSLLGYNNTAIMRNLKSVTKVSNNLLELLDKEQAVNGSSWYLPSYGEFLKLNSNFTVINESLQQAGGDLLKQFNSVPVEADEFYWTSTLNGQRQGWVYVFDSSVPVSNLSLNRGQSNKLGLFRFAVSF